MRKYQNLTSARDNFVFRSNVNKAEQDLPVIQKSNRLQLRRREARKGREPPPQKKIKK